MLGEEQTYALKNQKLSLDELSDELNDLLKSNNISKSLYDIFSIIDGVNASALPQTDTSWMSMVLNPMPSKLVKISFHDTAISCRKKQRTDGR